MAAKGKPSEGQDPSAAEEQHQMAAPEKAALGSELEALWHTNGEAWNTIMRTNEAVLKGMITLSKEMFDFGNLRFRENLERAQSLAQCHDLEEALKVNSDFFHSTTQEYLTESANLMKLMSEISEECWTPFEDQTKQALREIRPS